MLVLFLISQHMSNKQILLRSFLCSVGIFAYVILVANIMRNGEKFFGNSQSALSVSAFLLLFVISALITSLLALGWPIYLYFENEKKTAVKAILANAGWLIIITTIILLFLIIIK